MRLQTILFILMALLSCKQSEESLFQQALDLEKSGRYNDAIELYTKVLERNPRNEMAVFNRAWCWYLLDSNKIALADLDQLIRSKPKVGIEYRSNSVWDKSNSRWTVFTGEAIFQRAVVKFDMDSLKSAYADFKTCAESGHEASESYLYMGRIMAMYGKKDKACDYFRESLSRGNAKAMVLFSKGCP